MVCFETERELFFWSALYLSLYSVTFTMVALQLNDTGELLRALSLFTVELTLEDDGIWPGCFRGLEIFRVEMVIDINPDERLQQCVCGSIRVKFTDGPCFVFSFLRFVATGCTKKRG